MSVCVFELMRQRERERGGLMIWSKYKEINERKKWKREKVGARER